MSDIFISYAREDRPLAEALANDLKARGYRVWWDAELVGSDDFYEIILEALNKAKAAIVIWTKASARSRFVRDEARFALHLDKLIAVKDPGLDTIEIPFGFQGQHTDDISNREQIVKAVAKLGVMPASAGSINAPLAVERLAGAGFDEIVAFLGTNPPEAARTAAVARLKELAEMPTQAGARSGSDLVRSLKMSNWQAFLQGLTFRVPTFQLSTQGTLTSVGVALGYVVLIGAVTFGSIGMLLELRVDEELIGRIMIPLMALLCWLSWNRFNSFASQKNLVASIILGIAFALLCVYTPTVAMDTLFKSPLANGIAFFSGGVLALALVVWKIRAAR